MDVSSVQLLRYFALRTSSVVRNEKQRLHTIKEPEETDEQRVDAAEAVHID